MVLSFYNERRAAVNKAIPNQAHIVLAELESQFDTVIITQNVDDLHERAGSSQILHLHGKIGEARSEVNPNEIVKIEGDALSLGELDSFGMQLRPNIVWFGEDVPAIEKAIPLVETAEIFLVIGTSLQVYPAAGLLRYLPPFCPVYIVDPSELKIKLRNPCFHIREKAVKGIALFKEKCDQFI